MPTVCQDCSNGPPSSTRTTANGTAPSPNMPPITAPAGWPVRIARLDAYV